MIKVYIAHKMSGTEVEYLANVARLMYLHRWFAEAGFAPYNPASDMLMGIVKEEKLDVEIYKNISMAWLEASDALFVDGPISPGVQAEIDRAKVLNIPVFFSSQSIMKWRVERDLKQLEV